LADGVSVSLLSVAKVDWSTTNITRLETEILKFLSGTLSRITGVSLLAGVVFSHFKHLLSALYSFLFTNGKYLILAFLNFPESYVFVSRRD